VQKKQKGIITGIILVVCLLTALFAIIFTSPPAKTKKQHPVMIREEPAAPVFRKDGELQFVQNNKFLKTISIEIADNDAARTQGLMYRNSMPDSCGMLFIFESMQPLSFWMKNTQFPLDIIFVNREYKIVSIASHTVPFSETSIPSGKDAMYVVEVNAGFCQKNNITEDTHIVFELN